MNRDPLNRKEFFLYFLYTAFFAVFAKPFWPTDSEGASFHRTVFAVLAAVTLLRVILPGASGWMRSIPRVLRVALHMAWILPLAYVMFRVYAFSLSAAAVVSLESVEWLLAAEVMVVAVFIAAAVAGKRTGKFARIIAVTFLFIDAAMLLPLGGYLWRPPPASECEKNIDPRFVARLTSQRLTDECSTPYDVLYIEEKDALAASFKMAGNHVLWFWDRPAANRLVTVDFSGSGREVRELSLEGPLLAECLEWSGKRETLYVTGVGFGRHALTEINFSGFPEVSKGREIPLDYEPDGVAAGPDGKTIAVVGIKETIARFDIDTLEEMGERLTVPMSRGLNTIDTYRPPGSNDAFLAIVGGNIGVLDLAAWNVKYVEVPFGGGQVAAWQEKSLVFQTDILYDSLNVIDVQKMRLVKRINLGYKPRAVHADPARGILMIGEWLPGNVHVHDMETLEEIAEPVPVAGYIRNFAYDAGRGRLFCACKCGIYMVDVEGIMSR